MRRGGKRIWEKLKIKEDYLGMRKWVGIDEKWDKKGVSE